MSFDHSHITELLTEGQYTTVSVYFENERTATPARSALVPPQSNRRKLAWETEEEAFPFIPAALPARVYTYKCGLEMAKRLKMGSRVVVPSNSETREFRVGTVWQIHTAAQIDFEAKFEYKWLVQVLDTTEYDDHIAREQNFKALLLEVEKLKQREAIRAAVMANVTVGTEAFNVFQKALGVMGVPIERYVPAPAAQPAPAAAPVQLFTFGATEQPVAPPAPVQPAQATRAPMAPPKLG